MPTTIVESPKGDQLLALGALLGRTGKIIESEISGTSMGSTLPAGCRIRIRPLSLEQYRAGQVVAFVSGNAIFAHRIIFYNRQGALTRGDNRSWCDLPVQSRAILGLVTECLRDGKWCPVDDSVASSRDMPTRRRTLEIALRVCMQIDIRLARCASWILIWLARWRRRLTAEPLRIP
jgi:hypothetical protein